MLLVDRWWHIFNSDRFDVFYLPFLCALLSLPLQHQSSIVKDLDYWTGSDLNTLQQIELDSLVASHQAGYRLLTPSVEFACPPCVTMGLTHNHITWPCVLLLTCSACWRRMHWWRSGTGSRPRGSSGLLIRPRRVKLCQAVWLWIWSSARPRCREEPGGEGGGVRSRLCTVYEIHCQCFKYLDHACFRF